MSSVLDLDRLGILLVILLPLGPLMQQRPELIPRVSMARISLEEAGWRSLPHGPLHLLLLLFLLFLLHLLFLLFLLHLLFLLDPCYRNDACKQYIYRNFKQRSRYIPVTH